MSERKNIDTFFKELLEHSEVAPPEIAWENIEAKLNAKKKKKRRIIPFWWKLSGIAAILFLGLFLFGPSFNSNPKPNNPIVNQQNDDINSQKSTDSDTKIIPKSTNNKTQNETGVANQENETDVNSNKSNNSSTVSTNKNGSNAAISKTPQQTKVASVSNIKKKRASKGNRVSEKLISEEAIVSNPNQKKSLNTGKENSVSNIKQNNVLVERDKQNNISDKQKTTEERLTNTGINQNSLQKNNLEQDKNTISPSSLKDKNTIAVIENSAQKSEEIKKKDSTNLAVVEPNALEELLIEKEKKIAKERKENRWQVTPNIAPIYFSSMSNGSPLDEKLADNEKVYGANFSYGVNVNYSVNKKLKIRSGINTFSADYDTKNIVFYQNTNASRIQNVTPNLQGSLIQIDPLNNVNQSFGRLIEEKFEGTLNQRMGYIEMPLEVSYKLLSKKFGIDVIGGMSTLFLNQNDVYLKTNGFNMKIGEASNLNNIHFSTNIGLGLKYSFLKRFDARVEPVFKYQLNTYSSGAGSFKPYVFGIYSGISYHF